MKRHGNLYQGICTQEALLAAFFRARQGKRSHRACFEFERNLGTNIATLQQELAEETYRPRPCNRFWVHDGPKPRLIEAPAFRDLVVQHAVCAVVSPIMERRYIDTSFACRVGKGTHKAADWLQGAMRHVPRDSWKLHVDVRKFFYSIDRDVLMDLLRRHIKDRQLLRLLGLMAWRDAPTGIPIGNLMSQNFANIYLHSLDQFCKREIKIKWFARYMDDSIMFAPDRATAVQWLGEIRRHLKEELRLEISHYSLQPIKRGANFVGFRTWRKSRFVRPHVLSAFRRDARRNRVAGCISRLGHARRTCSFHPMMDHLRDRHHDLYRQLPEAFHAAHHRAARTA